MKNSSPGEDKSSRKALLELDSEDIATFFLQVTKSLTVPAAWSRSLLIPIPKPDKLPNILSNLRGIPPQQTLQKLLCYVSCLDHTVGPNPRMSFNITRLVYTLAIVLQTTF